MGRENCFFASVTATAAACREWVWLAPLELVLWFLLRALFVEVLDMAEMSVGDGGVFFFAALFYYYSQVKGNSRRRRSRKITARLIAITDNDSL